MDDSDNGSCHTSAGGVLHHTGKRPSHILRAREVRHDREECEREERARTGTIRGHQQDANLHHDSGVYQPVARPAGRVLRLERVSLIRVLWAPRSPARLEGQFDAAE